MLNATIATRTTAPHNQLISRDPSALRRGNYDQPATPSPRLSRNQPETTERDPFSLASPFCNPDL